MELVLSSLAGLQSFALYFLISIIALFCFKFVYTLITPYDEWALVKDNNIAAAIALAGAMIGFSLAVASAAANSVGWWDYMIWAIVALVAQLLAYAIVRFIFLKKIVQRIKDGEIAAAVILAGTSIAVGLLNAACMTY